MSISGQSCVLGAPMSLTRGEGGDAEIVKDCKSISDRRTCAMSFCIGIYYCGNRVTERPQAFLVVVVRT